MAEDTKNAQKEFKKFFEGMDFADLMRKMTEAKKAGLPFDCKGMMSQMIQKCCEGKKTKEGTGLETKENAAPGQ